MMKWGIDQGRDSIPLSAQGLSNVQPKGFFISCAGSVRCGRTSAVHAVIVCGLLTMIRVSSFKLLPTTK
jgi:hypothetical protein